MGLQPMQVLLFLIAASSLSLVVTHDPLVDATFPIPFRPASWTG
jgi:hypothetical protein